MAFTPDGRHLVVTTKANTNSILVYNLSPFGALAARPVVRAEDGTVPFAVAFDASGHLAVADAGPNAVATYTIHPDGVLVPLAVTPTGQAATCWIAISGRLAVASNAGSGTVTRLTIDAAGRTTRLGDTAAGGGTVDASFTPDGRFLYVQSGAAGEVTAFAVHLDGTVTVRGTVTVPDAVGGEGIAAW